jgi:hypothetical protein
VYLILVLLWLGIGRGEKCLMYKSWALLCLWHGVDLMGGFCGLCTLYGFLVYRVGSIWRIVSFCFSNMFCCCRSQLPNWGKLSQLYIPEAMLSDCLSIL